MNIKSKAPCKGCTDREPGCHSKCEKYITFRKELDEYNDNLRDSRNREVEIMKFKKNSIERMNRKRGKR